VKRKVSLLLAVTMTVAALFTGCGQSGGGSTAAAASGNADKSLVVGTYGAAATMNFNNTATSIDQVACYQVYDFLVDYDDSGKLEGDLAQSWDLSPDGKTLTFHIRQGVKFSDGTEVKASDVKFSLDQTKASAFISFILDSMDSCQVIDDYTVQLNLVAPDVTLRPLLTTGGVIESEKAVTAAGDKYGTSVDTVVGTGPYVLTDWKNGEEMTFEANPNYFKGAPSIKKFTLKTITDVNAAMIALQTGEISIYQNDIPGIAYDTIAKDAKLNIMDYPGARFYYVGMNCETGPFTDIRLRQAVGYAVDRQKALTAAFEGHGTVVDFAGMPDYAGYPGDLKIWPAQDLDKAKQLVQDAGMEGQSITLKTYTNSIYPKIATAVQDDLNQIGLNCDVQLVEAGTFNTDVYANGNSTIFIAGMEGDILDMSSENNILLLTSSIGAMNSPRYSNTDMDSYLTQAKAESDNAKRVDLYTKAMNLFAQDMPMVPLFYPSGSRAYSKDLVITNKFAARRDMVYAFQWNQ